MTPPNHPWKGNAGAVLVGFPETPFGVGLTPDWLRRDSYSVSHYTLILIFLSRSTYRIADGYMNYTISLPLFQASRICNTDFSAYISTWNKHLLK